MATKITTGQSKQNKTKYITDLFAFIGNTLLMDIHYMIIAIIKPTYYVST